MRTVFVNPSRKRSRRKSRRKARRSRPASRHYRRPARRRSRRRVRRNAGIAPFVQRNPLILENPRRYRHRSRRNPLSMSGFSLNRLAKKTLTYGSGSAIGAAVNILALRKIENDYMRNGARILAAFAAGTFMPGDMGAAAAGATLYPLFAELALAFKLVEGPMATSADLSDLAADLQDLVDETEDDDSDYGDDVDDVEF